MYKTMREVEKLVETGKPLLIKFEASWCGPCKMYAPTFNEVADNWEGLINTKTVDIDDNSDLTAKYGVKSVPTTLLVIDGEVEETLVGAKTKKELNDTLEKHV